jgi:hypothetical protein
MLYGRDPLAAENAQRMHSDIRIMALHWEVAVPGRKYE